MYHRNAIDAAIETERLTGIDSRVKFSPDDEAHQIELYEMESELMDAACPTTEPIKNR